MGEGEGVGERVWVTHMIVVVDDNHDGANDDQKRRDVQIDTIRDRDMHTCI